MVADLREIVVVAEQVVVVSGRKPAVAEQIVVYPLSVEAEN